MRLRSGNRLVHDPNIHNALIDMTIHQTVRQHFPKAIPEDDYIAATVAALTPHGFTADNSIACVSVCRDELTRSLVVAVQDAWGEAFNCSSLAGMLFLGKTGFLAAEHHAPRQNGIEHYVYYALPHIAIGVSGQIGECRRPGRDEPSSACGALVGFQKEMESGSLDLEFNPDDVEQSLLKQHLFKKVRYGATPGLMELTRLAHDAILEDLERMINLTVKTETSHYAVFTRIQIHGPEGQQFVSPETSYFVIENQRTDCGLL